jgi:hypothetical protein
MAYGLHWEWRGFGYLEDAVRKRIAGLRPLDLPRRKTHDQYVWKPGCAVNVKLRSTDSTSSLKFKRLIRDDRELELQLWLERANEDYAFPIQPQVVSELAKILDIELSVDGSIARPGDLIAVLQDASKGLGVVSVEKSRYAFAWYHGSDAVLVDLTEIRSPVATVTVGLEDTAQLGDYSSEASISAAGLTVAAARAALGLPDGMMAKSYVDVLRTWLDRR